MPHCRSSNKPNGYIRPARVRPLCCIRWAARNPTPVHRGGGGVAEALILQQQLQALQIEQEEMLRRQQMQRMARLVAK